MLRVAVLDDHPAVLAGLQRLLVSTPDLQPVAAVHSAQELLRQLDRSRPDVVVADYDLARGDGLSLCQALKERVMSPAVVIYSAYAGPGLAISARIAGADALVDKRSPANELLDAVRRAGAGQTDLPAASAEHQEAAIARLAPGDVPIAAMLLAGTSHQGIAETLATDRGDIVRRVRRIVGQLRPTAAPRPTADAYCRRCHATFDRPFPEPYGAICPRCVADGDIVSLQDARPQGLTLRSATAGQRTAYVASEANDLIARRSTCLSPVVTVPVLDGPAVEGLPHDDGGFLTIDQHGRVLGAPDVYAAGDMTSAPIKHRSVACQRPIRPPMRSPLSPASRSSREHVAAQLVGPARDMT